MCIALLESIATEILRSKDFEACMEAIKALYATFKTNHSVEALIRRAFALNMDDADVNYIFL